MPKIQTILLDWLNFILYHKFIKNTELNSQLIKFIITVEKNKYAEERR